MKAKNRDQSLSDSRELDGSYDQLTGKWGGPADVLIAGYKLRKIQHAPFTLEYPTSKYIATGFPSPEMWCVVYLMARIKPQVYLDCILEGD